ncbi:XVIPCD domain-containing protein, partial [Xanthomonas campestris]|uniref:XVIPCD domain-containing protein n=1 Tax=Xanthomonas campestris TaxID=339 RepID=UPI002B22CC97
ALARTACGSARADDAYGVKRGDTLDPVTQNMVDNLQSTINGSPFLAEEVKKSATTIDPSDAQKPKRAQLEGFGFLGPGIAAGGTYDGNNKVMNLPPLGLQTGSATNPSGTFNDKDMTFVLGHEIQHSFNHATKGQATQKFLTDIKAQANVRSPVHDYTDEIRTYIQAGREDEARAEIAGWNALLSKQQQANPSAGLKEMQATQIDRVRDFVTKNPSTGVVTGNSGLTFNQDGSLSQTPGNIAAMGQHYFDRPSPLYAQPGQRPVGLGEHRNQAGQLQPTADYPNYYGVWAVEQIVQAEDKANVLYQGSRPKVAIDMAALGLKERLIENEGLDRGANKMPFPYHDSSTAPPTLHHFDHTQDGSVAPAHDHTYVPVVPIAPAPPPPRGPDDPAHPDHALLEQARGGVRKLDEEVGKPYDAMSERISRSLLAVCKDNRDAYPGAGDRSLAENALTRVDHVVMGKTGNVFAVEGRLDDPAHKRVHVDVEQAIKTPVEQSDQQLLAANQALAQERALTQQHEVPRSMDEPSRAAPVR